MDNNQLIEFHLKAMREAAEAQQYDVVEQRYLEALKRATTLVGVEAPLLLLLICMAHHYESQDKMQQGERFNRRAREMIQRASVRFDERIAGERAASEPSSSD